MHSKKTRKLTVKQLIKKHPGLKTNNNCLTDIACPKCGNREHFRIQVKTICTLMDDGVDEHEDTEWGNQSFCQCKECDEAGTVKNFKFPNLDETLSTRKREQNSKHV